MDASEVAAKTCKLDDVVGHGWICRLRGFIGQPLVQPKYERIGRERSITFFKAAKGDCVDRNQRLFLPPASAKSGPRKLNGSGSAAEQGHDYRGIFRGINAAADLSKRGPGCEDKKRSCDQEKGAFLMHRRLQRVATN